MKDAHIFWLLLGAGAFVVVTLLGTGLWLLIRMFLRIMRGGV